MKSIASEDMLMETPVENQQKKLPKKTPEPG